MDLHKIKEEVEDVKEEEEEPPVVHIIHPESLDGEESDNLDSTDLTVSEYLKDNYGSTISVSDYLANNYPPKPNIQASVDDGYRSIGGVVSMVPPRRNSSTSSEGMTLLGNSKTHISYPEENTKYHTDNNDDEEVKKARRRMKNKISAQESRRRKKEYVDALELKMKQRDQEKRLLTEKVTELEDKVRQLVDQLFQAKQNQNIPTSIDAILKQQSVDAGTQTGICLECYIQSPAVNVGHQNSNPATNNIENDTTEDEERSTVNKYTLASPPDLITNERDLDSARCLDHERLKPIARRASFDVGDRRYHPYDTQMPRRFSSTSIYAAAVNEDGNKRIFDHNRGASSRSSPEYYLSNYSMVKQRIPITSISPPPSAPQGQFYRDDRRMSFSATSRKYHPSETLSPPPYTSCSLRRLSTTPPESTLSIHQKY